MTQVFYAHHLEEAALLLKKGELIAFPTETVYGLGAPIFLEVSIQKIFEVKRRPANNPLIAHIQSISQINEVATDIPKEAYLIAERFFPGPLTLVLKKKEGISHLVSKETIAFRMPQHELALNLIELVGEPLVAPSANLSGRPSPTKVSHVLSDLEGKIAGVVDGGPCKVGIESTVMSLLNPKKPLLLRAGSITQEKLEDFLKCRIEWAEGSGHCPGTRYRHYAPKASVFLFENQKLLKRHLENSSHKIKVAIPSEETLYHLLREVDEEGFDEICFLYEGKSQGLLDRLLRACGKK